MLTSQIARSSGAGKAGSARLLEFVFQTPPKCDEGRGLVGETRLFPVRQSAERGQHPAAEQLEPGQRSLQAERRTEINQPAPASKS